MNRVNGKINFLSGGGEMGELIRSKDWSATPIGHPETWPASLKTVVSVILSNPFAMAVLWGKEFVQIYNDGYRPILGSAKHPSALGTNKKETYAEVWHIIGPYMQDALEGKSVSFTDMLLRINRNGYPEDCYFTFSYSPVLNEDGSAGGVLVTVVETTGNRKNELALRESEERFRTMAEGTDMYIAVGDETGNAVYFNNAWQKLTGRPVNDLLRFGWTDLIHPEDKEQFLKIFFEALEKKAPFTGEFRILAENGQYRWLLASGPPRFRPDGSFAGYISSCVDITEHKQIEQKLLENKHLLMSVINSAPFPIGVYEGKEMLITLANQNIIDTWGKGNEVVGKTYMEVLPELADTGIYGQLQDVLETGIPFHAKNQRVDLVVDNKLQPFYFNYSFTPLYDPAGKIMGVMNTAANVTDIAIANLKVQESEKSLRQTILQAPVAMCLLKGPEHIVEIANERMFALWGKQSADMQSKPLFVGLPEVKHQGFDVLLDNVFTTGETFVAEGVPVNLPRKDTIETVYVNFVYEAYREPHGVTGILVVAVDVTAQVIAMQNIEEIVEMRTKELAEAIGQLQKSNAELAQFAYIASHDLQEPLRKISNYSQMLEKRSVHVLDEQSAGYLSKINSASARMHTLIRDVLTYSELVKDKEIFENVNLDLVLKSVLTDFELLIEQKNAVIRYATLPEIEAIPLQMSQLMGNILGNALKFSRKDTRPEITISYRQATNNEISQYGLNEKLNYLIIQFADNGIGFKEEFADKIFNIFQRLHRKSEYEGTGIGLALCKKIILNHKGELNAAGSSENGAVFNVYLPYVQTR